MNRTVSFTQVDPSFLRTIAGGNIRTPSLYYHPNFLLREGFWSRLRAINQQMDQVPLRLGHCLDFGGGSGVFLPTLAQRFQSVICVDVDPADAKAIVHQYQLNNVSIQQENALTATYPVAAFDAIVAADVLEHFADLKAPVTTIKQLLAKDGYLFTSLPTENWVYLLLRQLFGMEKPDDHYHTAAQVETYLAASGFRAVSRAYLPVWFAPLFRVTSWRLG
jgi:predicted TPR repeat methyltransferase